ncbi:zinc ABC transporter substrate-binding protein [Pseudoclavibacter sp. RFBJ3]|uniref:zinc ABC transporter substrate-binding protein AztC n=1 Tax=unclassified Pseudoclavibacter TaxID=2615177 RepID=UPI000CE7E3EA|nr:MULTISPECIES: zinc ABC transporter substrate-binding protein AztC [unclassified Pseudoclavibacter]PPF83810.1 zinc ABC transporter substrate-binding protein [Pseudoclavibacter sp. RFBJ5]PPF92090.1 zinc ABC transporter substrate-binding protein [Pseudoclavibacter sp. RFBJ3]PPF96953.1 zinc ABC transporter substrate-binding protein [Pseudoclavibacter sp. RFBH5]PPG23640.1 zinc ABC transporter substrate-binding protein [Pseudoclavibacter sp. RFBI4]
MRASTASRSTRNGLGIVASLAIAAGLVSCSATAADDRPEIVVTTNILGDVVTELVGDQASVVTLMKPGADPHSFSLTAQEAASIENADFVVSNGLGLEEGVAQHLEQVDAAGIPHFVASDAFEPLSYTEGDAEGMDDPHFWTDPARMSAVVDALGTRLATDLDGLDAAALDASVAAYESELDELDEWMQGEFDTIPSESKSLVTNHHVFGYLAERFGFTVVGTVIPGGTTLAAPSAADFAELSAEITAARVPTIFADSSSPDDLARALAEEAGIDVRVEQLFTESLTPAGGGAETYLEMMRANTERITTGLTS